MTNPKMIPKYRSLTESTSRARPPSPATSAPMSTAITSLLSVDSPSLTCAPFSRLTLSVGGILRGGVTSLGRVFGDEVVVEGDVVVVFVAKFKVVVFSSSLSTGATGGVGSMAVGILGKLGYNVVAATGKQEEEAFLKSLGATSIVGREEVTDESKRPMIRGRNFVGPLLTAASSRAQSLALRLPARPRRRKPLDHASRSHLVGAPRPDAGVVGRR